MHWVGKIGRVLATVQSTFKCPGAKIELTTETIEFALRIIAEHFAVEAISTL